MRGNTILLNPTGNAFSSSGSAVTTTQPVLFPDGTQTVPSIAFSSDSDTGFFWNASGDFRITSNASPTVAFRSADVLPVSNATLAFGGSGNNWSNIFTKTLSVSASLTNPTMGEVTLSGASGSAIAYTTAVSATSTSKVFLSKVLGRGTQGHISVTTSIAANQFTIASSSTTDTSVVAWWIVQAT